MTDWAADAADVQISLAEEGQTISFSYSTGGAKLATGETTGASGLSFTSSAVATYFSTSEIDGTIIQEGDVKLLVDAVNGEPKPNYGCTVDGVDYRVINVWQISPAGTPVLYKVQVRK